LDACHPTQRTDLEAELQLIRQTTQAGIHSSRRSANDTTWALWEDFCVGLFIDPELVGIDDPIPLLQLFGQRYRQGIIAPSGIAVRSQTMEGALRAVGQAFSTLGGLDPRLTANGKLDIRLSRQLSAYKKEDPPPHRVKPIPLPIIGYAADMCRLANRPMPMHWQICLSLVFTSYFAPENMPTLSDDPQSLPSSIPSHPR